MLTYRARKGSPCYRVSPEYSHLHLDCRDRQEQDDLICSSFSHTVNGGSMRAKMSISNLSVPLDKIKNIGGKNEPGQAGHKFTLSFQVKVQRRPFGTLGVLSGEGID